MAKGLFYFLVLIMGSDQYFLLQKGALEYIHHENPDVLCLQEIKCSDSKLPQEEVQVQGYHTYWSHSEVDGYSGLGLYTKVKPITVKYGMGIPEFDKEGRLLVAEYDKFSVVNVCKYLRTL